MNNYTVKFISRFADFDVTFEHIPAESEYEAEHRASRFLAAPEAWLGVNTAEESADGALDPQFAKLRSVASKLAEALRNLHACHRAFSGSEDWGMLDEDARDEAEGALEAWEALP